MRVPVSWLRSHCDPGLGPDELADRLAMTGTEVERVVHQGPPSSKGFVVGRVVEVAPHPDADRLAVCAVDVGDGSPATIVCGAPNVAAGQTVAVALPGALMPDGTELGRAELRGVTSEGMICSEAELELGDDGAGIAVLEDGPEPGSPLAEVLPVAEPVLELEVTPNRPDCYAVYGVAREVHAWSGAPLGPAPWEVEAEAAAKGEVNDYASVTVEVPELCPRFTARVFLDLQVGPSPPWLRARLAAAGQRPINNVVDVTNYVMLETGQPLHAFDLDRVPDGALIVRRAAEGETMTTLDGVERRFDSNAVLVCDANGPSGIAGIMGGASSEVSDTTTRVLLEVATWNGVNILETSNRLGLRSEASTRFEKQLHPELAMRAQRLASSLLVTVCGAKLVPGTIDVLSELPEPHRLTLRTARVEKLLGERIDAASSAEYLGRLGFGVESANGDLEVEVPPERHFDVSREVDLIEEVARIHGLERLPATLPTGRHRVGGLTREQSLRRRAEDVMRDLGFLETVSWSFNDPALAERLRLPADDPRASAVTVQNPFSIEGAAMRTTLLGSLLDAARHNLSRGAEHVALFESGRVYLREPESGGGSGFMAGEFAGRRRAPAVEPERLGALVAGPAPSAWRGSPPETDFFALKGRLEALCAHLDAELVVEPADEPFLHPGKAAAIGIGGEPAGWLGELHPLVARDWDLPAGVALELSLANLVSASRLREEVYEDVTTYPGIYEDVAVAIPAEVAASDVRDAILEAAGELLRSARVFDLYEGEQVGEGRKSIALRLEFRAPDRTLTDAEVAERRQAIAGALAAIGGSLRE